MRSVGLSVALILGLACAALGAGCGASPAGMPAGETWVDGTTFSAPVEIAAGTTVTIAPGARLTAAKNVTITVRGTLRAASASGAHAVVARAAADDVWTGLVVEAGGTLDAAGLDLEGAETALDVREGAATVRYDAGTITGASYPMTIERGARVDTSHATVVDAGSSMGVKGELRAKYLDYGKVPGAAGVFVGDPQAIFDVEDSRFHGPLGAQESDYITVYGAKLVRVAYSTINDAHCGFHFNDVERYEIDHVTVGADAPTASGGRDVWGAMLYGSGAGPNVIASSNFLDTTMDLDLQGANGPLTVTGTYTMGHNVKGNDAWTFSASEAAAAPVPDAHPR